MFICLKYGIEFNVHEELGWVYTALNRIATQEPWNIGFVDYEAHSAVPVGDEVWVGSGIKDRHLRYRDINIR